MSLVQAGPEESSVLLVSHNREDPVASLKVSRDQEMEQCPWRLDWSVVFCVGGQVNGHLHMDSQLLRQAFGLSDQVSEVGAKWLVERYGATTAFQGLFIRSGEYLNIPGPGTGSDGDPNLSVFLDDEMRNAIRLLLERYHN